MTDQRSHMRGCQGIKTQQVLTGIWEAREAIAGSVSADLYAAILGGLTFIQSWLDQTRSERTEGRNKCTEHDHATTIYHTVENGWRILAISLGKFGSCCEDQYFLLPVAHMILTVCLTDICF